MDLFTVDESGKRVDKQGMDCAEREFLQGDLEMLLLWPFLWGKVL